MYKGKLSYTLAGIAVIWGVYGFFAGLIDGQTASQAIFAGLAVFGIRRAV